MFSELVPSLIFTKPFILWLPGSVCMLSKPSGKSVHQCLNKDRRHVRKLGSATVSDMIGSDFSRSSSIYENKTPHGNKYL